MIIAIIGSGNVGSALGTGWAKKGHQVVYGSRNPQKPELQSRIKEIGATACGIREAVSKAEVVVLATPWSGVEETIRAAGSLEGKIILDAINPLGQGFKLATNVDQSAAEQVASWTKSTRVVKAFNSIGAGIMVNPVFGADRANLFICGDDAEAKKAAGHLGSDLGFEVVDCGPLSMARALESLAVLWINLAYTQRMGPTFAFKLIKR